LERLRSEGAVRPKLRDNRLNLIRKIRELLAEVGAEFPHVLIGILLYLSECAPLVLDGFLKLVHPGGCILLGTRLDRAPVSQALFEQSILPFLPQVQ
jgi:hypothetical protein